MSNQTKKILIVDDSQSIIDELVRVLTLIGFNSIKSALCLKDGYTLLEEQAKNSTPFDLIFCDHHLPDGVGLSLLEKLRKDPILEKTPFITITSDARRSIILPYILAGSDGYVAIPLSSDEILKKMSLAWAKRGV